MVLKKVLSMAEDLVGSMVEGMELWLVVQLGWQMEIWRADRMVFSVALLWAVY